MSQSETSVPTSTLLLSTRAGGPQGLDPQDTVLGRTCFISLLRIRVRHGSRNPFGPGTLPDPSFDLILTLSASRGDSPTSRLPIYLGRSVSRSPSSRSVPLVVRCTGPPRFLEPLRLLGPPVRHSR